MLSLYIVPTKITSEITYKNVLYKSKSAINNFLNRNEPKSIIELKVNLWDNFTVGASAIAFQLEDPFIWRDPELESVFISIEKNGECIEGMLFDCETIRYNNLIFDIINEEYYDNLSEEKKKELKGFKFYWRCSIKEEEFIKDDIFNIAKKYIIATIADLTDGLILYNDDIPIKANQFLALHKL